MGILTNFFLATDGQLRAHYPQRRLPLDAPVPVMRMNPFTGTKSQVMEWDPSPEDIVEEDGPVGPPSPSIDLKGVNDTSVSALLRIVLGAEVPTTFDRPALVGPPEGPWIRQVPASCVEALAKLDARGRARVVTAWTAHEQADAATLSSASTRGALEGRDEEHWRAAVEALAKLARRAVKEERNVYLWMSL